MKFSLFDLNENPAKYQVEFTAKVKNLSSDPNLVQIVMPFPLQSTYQKIIGKYTLSPKGKMKKESKFQNQYIAWREVFKLKEEKTFNLKFKISIKPRNKPIKENINLSKFLKGDKFIDPKMVSKISNNLTKQASDIYKKVKMLNDYVVNNLEYGNPIKGLYTTNQALKTDAVDCGGFDTLLASLCISQKIPARIISGFFANNNNQMHAWVEIFIAGEGWIAADPSIEKLSKEGRSEKRAKLGNVPADRIALSVGQNHNLGLEDNTSLKLDILQNPQSVAQKGEKSIKLETEFKTREI